MVIAYKLCVWTRKKIDHKIKLLNLDNTQTYNQTSMVMMIQLFLSISNTQQTQNIYYNTFDRGIETVAIKSKCIFFQ